MSARWKPFRVLQTQIRSYATRPKPPVFKIGDQVYERDSWSNATPTILDKLPRQLHLDPSHPIGILRTLIEAHFVRQLARGLVRQELTPFGQDNFEHLNSLSPIVTVAQNFDDLGKLRRRVD